MSTLTKPSPGNITRPYGPYRANGIVKFHYGTDRGWGNGKAVQTMAAGTVVSTAYLPDYGQTVTILHDETIGSLPTYSRYCHLSSESVGINQWVPALAVIGQQGDTGSLTSQIHLHSELYVNGARVDETRYQTNSASSSGETTTITPDKDKNMPEYIYTTESGVGYALIDSNYVDGVIITADVNVANQFSYLTNTSGIQQSRAVFNARCAAAVALWRAHAAVAVSGGAYVDANHLDDAEAQSLLTSTANVINAHTTAAKDEVLAAIDGIETGSALANFSIELTGTAAPSA